jgi:hypothetical protein
MQAEFNAKELIIPTGIQRELIVSDDVSAFLSLTQVIENDHRHLFEPELPRSEEAPVAGNDTCFRIHEDRVVEAELGDACGNLGYLRVGVRPGIPSPRDQLVDQP